MKKLGIIGGAGPLASALFYETLVQESYRLQQALPEILLLNYPFTRGLTVEENQRSGSISRQELLHCLNTLEVGGATLAVLVCNTLHLELARIPHPGAIPKSTQKLGVRRVQSAENRFLQRGSYCQYKPPLQESISRQLSIPPDAQLLSAFGYMHLLRIPDCVLKEVCKRGDKRLLLLGTQTTCASSLYSQTGITLLCPSVEAQGVVDRVIDHVLEGHICAEDARLIEQVIEGFAEAIDGVILGCTDLPVLHHHFPIHSTKSIYDSVKISAKTILRYL